MNQAACYRAACRLVGQRPRSCSGWRHGPDSDAAHSTDRSTSTMTTGPETRYRVRGGHPLQGTVFVQGAKNAALKMIAASLLAEKGRTVLRNVPVDRGRAPGGRAGPGRGRDGQVPRGRADPGGRRFRADQPGAAGRDRPPVPRLGAVRARAAAPARRGDHRGHRRLQPRQPQPGLPLPGLRPARAPRWTRARPRSTSRPTSCAGAHLYLDTPSHTGTENLIMAAALAPGTTVIDNTRASSPRCSTSSRS